MTANPSVPPFNFETIPGDPLETMVYTLSNGLKLFLSVNRSEPRIYTNIAVRAGSKHDPPETTGLAHYLEHMLFKGTSRIATINWEKEEELLRQISDLYEKHRFETDPKKRGLLYAEIDRLSNEAARYSAPNEYDKLVSALGAKGTNAYTWVEQTVYVNDIPSNELERWMELESERFRECVLRLFHTELETVYEEFNISQDNDYRKVYKVVGETLFPSHPYGTQMTIGIGEHLKNPSHVKIQEYFNTYYVPNNMAVILAGDFDPQEAVVLAERYFGSYASKPVPPFTCEPQPELQGTVRKEVYGQEAAYAELSWRLNGADSEDALILPMLRGILHNRRAGLIDINLIQKQRMLEASASFSQYEDYSIFRLYGKPREGQSLEEVEQLLLEQLELLKKGQFEDWLIEALLKDYKLAEMHRLESNPGRVSLLTNYFILGLPWEAYVGQFEQLTKLSREDIVRFANERLNDNYVCIFKHTGEDPNVYKVPKPAITPVPVNRTAQSEFAGTFLARETTRIQPVFLNYDELIQTRYLASGVPIDYIHNTTNPTFTLDYIVEMGRNHDPMLAMAISYLPYLGTDRFSPEQLRQEFFRLGLAFNVSVNNERIYVTLTGLDESFEEGVQLFEHLLNQVQGNDQALRNLVDDILVRRLNATKDKRTILRSGMYSYSKYGPHNPFSDIIPETTLRQLDPGELVHRIRTLTQYEHRVFYYGSLDPWDVVYILDRHHRVPRYRLPVQEPDRYTELSHDQPEVLFVDFPMIQAELLWLSKGTPYFNLEEYIMGSLYNEYFGSGLSSIVFQEIRESKALAYSAYAAYTSPVYQDRSHYLQAYIGTQSDKLTDAVPAMLNILDEMPVSENQIEHARQSILRKIETGRILKDEIYWSFRFAQQRGLNRDIRRDVYQRLQTTTPADLIQFQQQYVKDRTFSLLVLGSRDKLDFDFLSSFGPVRELSLSEIFGFEVKS